MIAIKQRITTLPTGNCFAACVASILERPIWTVPNFCVPRSDGLHWWEAYARWLHSEGFHAIEVKHAEIGTTCSVWAPGRLCIASGPSPRGDWNHSVVAELSYDKGLLTVTHVHDPHPSGDFVKGVAELDFIFPQDVACN